MRTKEQQHIEQVAGIILESHLTSEEAREINDGDGWSFDICYDQETYSEGWFTRRVGVTLSADAIETASRTAALWAAEVARGC